MTTPQHTALIRSSWRELGPQAPAFAVRFYATLFTLDPALKPLFKGDMARQRLQLVGMLGSAIKLLDEPDSLLPALRSLGRRHGGNGVQDAHYAVVGRALLDTLAQMLGDGFTPAVRAAWTRTYGFIAQVMVEAARMPRPALEVAPTRGMAAVLAIALLATGAAAMPVEAQQVGWHPATSARRVLVVPIDPNTFIVGHPASPTTRGGHAGGEHPAVLMARAAGQRGIDANTFIVQPPVAVTWISPLPDDAVRYAQTLAAQPAAR